jgi:hypothetical protein
MANKKVYLGIYFSKIYREKCEKSVQAKKKEKSFYFK